MTQRLRQKKWVDGLAMPQGYSRATLPRSCVSKAFSVSPLKKKVGVAISLECRDVSVYSKACTPTLGLFTPLSYYYSLINIVPLSLHAFMYTNTHMYLL